MSSKDSIEEFAKKRWQLMKQTARVRDKDKHLTLAKKITEHRQACTCESSQDLPWSGETQPNTDHEGHDA